jgi:hypothetical protein
VSREGEALTNKESQNKSSLKRKSKKVAVVVERESHQQIHSREKESVSKSVGASVGAHGSSTSGVAHEVKNSPASGAGSSQGMKISSSSSKLILPCDPKTASSLSQSTSSSSTVNPSPSKLVLPCDEKSSSSNSPQKTSTVLSQSVSSESVSKSVSWCSVEYGQKDSNSASGGSSNTKKDSKKKGKNGKKEWSRDNESAQQTPSGNSRDSGHKKLVLPGETPKPQQDLIHSSDGENVTSQAGIAATSIKRSSSFAASSISSRPPLLVTTASASTSAAAAAAAAASPVSTPKGGKKSPFKTSFFKSQTSPGSAAPPSPTKTTFR